MTIPGASSRLTWVDHQETYGRHIIQTFLHRIPRIELAVDIGCGYGNDLGIVKSTFPKAKLIGIDVGNWNQELLHAQGIHLQVCNIECDELPIPDDSADLIIANQVLEHVKEIFWINHQIAKKLKVGGYLVVGVPNIASLHNRLLLLFGVHPTQWKSYSAHVRPFSKADTLKFYDLCYPGGYKLLAFRGSQFYPFGRSPARILSSLAPTLSFSIFFLFQKQREYSGEILLHPTKARLETNYFLGTMISDK